MVVCDVGRHGSTENGRKGALLLFGALFGSRDQLCRKPCSDHLAKRHKRLLHVEQTTVRCWLLCATAAIDLPCERLELLLCHIVASGSPGSSIDISPSQECTVIVVKHGRTDAVSLDIRLAGTTLDASGGKECVLGAGERLCVVGDDAWCDGRLLAFARSAQATCWTAHQDHARLAVESSSRPGLLLDSFCSTLIGSVEQSSSLPRWSELAA